MDYIVTKGATSKIALIFIQDSSSTTGAGLTGLAFNTASLVAYRARSDDGNAGGIAMTLATATKGTWTSIGFVEKDATNMPGWYEFGIPNAALASGSDWCAIEMKGATNMVPFQLLIQLTGADFQDTVRAGLTALPNAAATSAGGLPTVGTGASQIDVDASGRVNVGKWLGTLVTAATAGIPDVNTKNINNVSGASVTTVAAVIGTTIAPTFTGSLIKSDVTDWNGTAVSAPATAGIPEVNIKNMNNVSAAAITTVKAVQGLAVDGQITTVTGNVNGSVGSVTGAVGSVTGNVGGNVTGSVGSVATGGIAAASFAAGAITAAVIATDAVDADALAADALTEIFTKVLTTALTESYNADGSPPTLAQALFVIMQRMTEFSISGTTITVKGLDGSTSKYTLTLDDATNPTSTTRAT